MTATRCGYVAVVGRPNVGKSTLVNAIMGSKVSIVTHKPQTTRHRILAVHTAGTVQIVFVDTPGLHRSGGKAMNRLMNRAAASALADADLILFVTDATRWTDDDGDVLERLRTTGVPVVAVLNKVDRVTPKSRLLATMAGLAERYEFAEIVPASARKGTNIDELLRLIPKYLPESPFYFPADMRTDRGPEFYAAEIIREKLTMLLHQEIPYGLTVQIERFEESREGILIHSVVWVERESQKGIVVGKGGDVLKNVGRAARTELKAHFRKPVHLELWVRVKENWSDSEQDLLRLGYEAP